MHLIFSLSLKKLRIYFSLKTNTHAHNSVMIPFYYIQKGPSVFCQPSQRLPSIYHVMYPVV